MNLAIVEDINAIIKNLNQVYNIEEFKEDVDWKCISKYQNLTESFIEEFDLTIPENSWLYKDTGFKKQQVLESRLYECYGVYFLAYKTVRKDNYSVYNFQYQYLPGKIYKSHADHTSEENSFGLSVWTEKDALDYYSRGKLLLVKVFYKDVARMVHQNGKIRCTRLEVLKEIEMVTCINT